MKTLWIISELFPPDETSTAYILGNIANVMSNKYVVKVICGPAVYDNKWQNNHTSLENVKNVEIYRIKGLNIDKNKIFFKFLNFIYISFSLIRIAKKRVSADDKVLAVTNPALIIPFISKLKKKIGFDLNLLIHDVFPENTKSAGLNIPFYSMIKHIYDKAYSAADQLIVLGRDMKNVVERKINNSNVRISVIENWADTDSIAPKSFNSDKIVIQYAGNIGRVQGLEKIIDNLPADVEFHIYGSGAMEDYLKKKNKSNVFFHGPYLRSQQQDILSQCHIAIVTLEDSMYGLGVPSKSYNIMAAGRPILYFGPLNSEIELLIKEYNIGYCGWPNEWNLAELKLMGNLARSLALEKFSKQVILNRYLNIL